MSIRILEFKVEDGKDMYLVDYPEKGQRWVYSFMIGGQYKDEKAALKYRYEQRNSNTSVNGQADGPVAAADLKPSSDGTAPTSVRPTGVDTRESLKCICQQQQATAGEETITCSLCSKKSHLRCVRAEGQSASEIKEWQCPFCRLLHMDPFNPGVELLMFTATPRNMLAQSSQEGNLSMRFNVQPNILKDWQSKKMSVVVRCVGLGPKSLNVPKGPLWPKDATASVNTYKDVFRIQPGKYGHVRREVPSKEITDLVKPNSNTVTISYRTEPPANTQIQPPRFLFGVVACEGRTKQDILSLIKRPSIEESRQRDIQIVELAHEAFVSMQSQDLMIESKADFDIVHTRCPLSLWEISTPVRGIECEHLECYDADSYIDVNIKTRNVEKRWRCPVCSKLARPEDLIVDEFLASGMVTARKSLALPADEPLLKRFKLHTQRREWELLEDEALEGEGSEDEGEEESGAHPEQKRQKTSTAAEEEIVLD
jgi:hypothetical protein